MRLSHAAPIFALLASIGFGQPAASDAPAGKPALKPIREFTVEVLSRLGREMYRHDQLAWVATDLLMQGVSQAQLASDGAAGWVVDAKDSGAALVRFLRTKGESLEASYDVTFPESGKPKVRMPLSRMLTPSQLARAKAMRTGTDAYVAASLPWCGGQFNAVVLDDPDGSGYLVYLLRPIPARDVIPVGGHYRITVSADGSEAEQIDQLFVSCLTVDPRQGVPKGAKPVAASMSHIVSDTPVETHVFLSLQARMPFSVITRDSRIWMIEDGEIRELGAGTENGQTDGSEPGA